MATEADWFEQLTGFPELSPVHVRAQLRVEGSFLVSRANDRRLRHGSLETPSLTELRDAVAVAALPSGSAMVDEVVANVVDLHRDAANREALFQVASQSNLLEMPSPERCPEEGVTIYEHDRTQGPACAMACAAGTIYRNHLVPLGGQVGQSTSRQLDCFADLGRALGNAGGKLWETRNGYVLPDAAGLATLGATLRDCDPQRRDTLRGRLRIGLQWQTEVTLPGATHIVSQAYCSALPMSYTNLPEAAWTEFAPLVLEAAYEATLLAAIRNLRETGCDRVYLTLLGGGAFGNPTRWIQAALSRALRLVEHTPLRISVVSHGRRRHAVREVLDSL